MATLSDIARTQVWLQIMNDLSNRRDESAFLNTELRTALNAADQWVSDNKASYNSALPLPFRTDATTSQKALLLQFVVQKRFLEGI